MPFLIERSLYERGRKRGGERCVHMIWKRVIETGNIFLKCCQNSLCFTYHFLERQHSEIGKNIFPDEVISPTIMAVGEFSWWSLSMFSWPGICFFLLLNYSILVISDMTTRWQYWHFFFPLISGCIYFSESPCNSNAFSNYKGLYLAGRCL